MQTSFGNRGAPKIVGYGTNASTSDFDDALTKNTQKSTATTAKTKVSTTASKRDHSRSKSPNTSQLSRGSVKSNKGKAVRRNSASSKASLKQSRSQSPASPYMTPNRAKYISQNPLMIQC